MQQSVFAKYENKAWPHRYDVSLHVSYLVGGIPTDKRVIAGWLKTKAGIEDTYQLDEAVAEVMAERQVEKDEALDEVIARSHLNGFKRDDQGLYIEGRQVKACLKEGANVAVATGKLAKGRAWGETKKGLLGFLAEHVFVVDDRIHLGRTEADGTHQRFVHTFRGAAIQYEEYVEDVKVDFTLEADHLFNEETWAQIWLTASRQGIGAVRSAGYGKFTVTRFDKVEQ